VSSTSGQAVTTTGPQSYVNVPSSWSAFNRYTLNPDGTVDASSTTYTDGQKVAGIAVFAETTDFTSHGIDVTTPFPIATVIVPTGNPVFLLPASSGAGLNTTRSFAGHPEVITNFEPNATEFISDIASGAQNEVTVTAINDRQLIYGPEPSSAALIGIALGAMLARRRRSPVEP
jgi:hypothetical protein